MLPSYRAVAMTTASPARPLGSRPPVGSSQSVSSSRFEKDVSEKKIIKIRSFFLFYVPSPLLDVIVDSIYVYNTMEAYDYKL